MVMTGLLTVHYPLNGNLDKIGLYNAELKWLNWCHDVYGRPGDKNRQFRRLPRNQYNVTKLKWISQHRCVTGYEREDETRLSILPTGQEVKTGLRPLEQLGVLKHTVEMDAVGRLMADRNYDHQTQGPRGSLAVVKKYSDANGHGLNGPL